METESSYERSIIEISGEWIVKKQTLLSLWLIITCLVIRMGFRRVDREYILRIYSPNLFAIIKLIKFVHEITIDGYYTIGSLKRISFGIRPSYWPFYSARRPVLDQGCKARYLDENRIRQRRNEQVIESYVSTLL
jgi:hypothetical protein